MRVASPSRTKPPQSQELFDHISNRAEERGMVVNKKKMGLLCASGAVSFDPRAHLKDGENNTVKSEKKLKLLGFVFDSDASVKSQAAGLKAKFRSRTWALERLKKCGMSCDNLVRVYKSSIRPVAEYASAVIHPMLNNDQSYQIERQQNQALKLIFGPGISAKK